MISGVISHMLYCFRTASDCTEFGNADHVSPRLWILDGGACVKMDQKIVSFRLKQSPGLSVSGSHFIYSFLGVSGADI